MPNRILRDWTYSDLVDKISFQAEVLFTRLIMKADDYGSYFAKPKLINGNCFPLKDIRESDISRWLQELASAGLIVFYTAGNKEYLNIINFNQRLRSMKKCFPQVPDNVIKEHSRAFCQQVDRDLTATCPPEVETETETEVETEEEEKKKETPPNFKKLIKEEFHEDLKKYIEEFSKPTVSAFFNYWSEADVKGKMRFQKQDTWETKLRLITWKNKEAKWTR